MDRGRLDRWLWAARCFKTRANAAAACSAGHVKVNGASAKPAKAVRPGDRIEIRLPHGLRILEVVQLSERRGSADVARMLYLDHSPPPPPREERNIGPTRDPGAGRPSKRDRRQLRKARGW